MSELTEAIHDYECEACIDFDSVDYTKAAPFTHLKKLLPAHNAKIREEAKWEQKNADVEILRECATEYFPDNSPGWEFVDKVMGTIEITYYNEREVMEAEIAQDIAKAKREQMEADCRAVCYMCAEGDMPWLDEDQWNTWRHGHDEFQYCCADGIRAAWAKEHPEEAKGE